MEIQEKILTHLSAYGKENRYRLARALKIDVSKVTEALDVLEKEGKIEMKEGKASLAKEKPIVEAEQEIEKSNQEEVEEGQLQTEVIEEEVGQEKIEGTVRFYNLNKGFGFIDGDNGKGYRLNESGIKEVVEIKAGDRVLFKPIIGYKGPEADDVETL